MRNRTQMTATSTDTNTGIAMCSSNYVLVAFCTGTFKHRKVDMVKAGIDPAQVKDAMYWLNVSAKPARCVRVGRGLKLCVYVCLMEEML